MKNASIAFKLCLPVIIFFVSLAITITIGTTSQSTFTIQLLNTFGLSFPVKNLWLAKGVTLASGVAWLSAYLFYDYSTFFPQYLNMDVYFDNVSLLGVLSQTLTEHELTSLNVMMRDEEQRKQYFKSLDQEARAGLGEDVFFGIENGSIHSAGNTVFKVKKIDGWQRYHIEEAKGELTHTLYAAHIPEIKFRTFFDKMPICHDYIEPSLRQLFIKRQVVLHPQFKQSLAEVRTSKSVSFNVCVVGLTYISHALRAVAN